jgi:hypothetical protein
MITRHGDQFASGKIAGIAKAELNASRLEGDKTVLAC